MRVQPLEPRRVRYPRGPYGWIELKVVTGGVFQEVGSDAAFTYLFLCAVGNRDGVSFWSRQRMAQTLGLSSDATEAAIRKLQARDLIAANGRVIQVLSLPALGGAGGGQPADRAGIAGAVPGATITATKTRTAIQKTRTKTRTTRRTRTTARTTTTGPRTNSTVLAVRSA